MGSVLVTHACLWYVAVFCLPPEIMPELPEVETTLAGIAPHITGRRIDAVTVREGRLRWPVATDLAATLRGQHIRAVTRRAKYLLLHTDAGCVLIHLGMSGSLRVFTPPAPPPLKHDHIDLAMDNGVLLRLHDPRRFGALLWFAGTPEHHPLLQHLGPEPLAADFNADYLRQALAKQKRALKLALMDKRIVVGVGNIYANEALFQAAIAPTRPANSLKPAEYAALVAAIQDVLQRAIAAGGSTLRDFVNSDGRSGYFQQHYAVYGRNGQICRRCGGGIVKITQGQRSSFYCPDCQR